MPLGSQRSWHLRGSENGTLWRRPSVALELCKDLKQASNAAKWAEKCNATEADFEALSALFNGSGKKLVIVGKQFAQAEQFASCVALAQQIDAKFIALKGAVNTYVCCPDGICLQL